MWWSFFYVNSKHFLSLQLQGNQLTIQKMSMFSSSSVAHGYISSSEHHIIDIKHVEDNNIEHHIIDIKHVEDNNIDQHKTYIKHVEDNIEHVSIWYHSTCYTEVTYSLSFPFINIKTRQVNNVIDFTLKEVVIDMMNLDMMNLDMMNLDMMNLI